MDLFPNNTDIEGATIINACYGGTAALLNAFTWCESDGWDGRYAIVVAADIATYARGPARPTCGAGAVAVLVGRDAPLSFNPKERATHATNVWDFFKPDHTVEYPTVDGALSQVCYYQALEDVYTRFCDKLDRQSSTNNGNGSPKNGTSSASPDATAKPLFDAETPDYFVFHAPYNKLVQKSYARLHLIDARRKHEAAQGQEGGGATAMMDEAEEKKDDTKAGLHNNNSEWLTKPLQETYSDKALEGVLKKLSADAYKKKLSDSNLASKLVGNTYTASVFLGLASLIDTAGGRGDLTPGKSIVLFSYGSGALATMYRLSV